MTSCPYFKCNFYEKFGKSCFLIIHRKTFFHEYLIGLAPGFEPRACKIVFQNHPKPKIPNDITKLGCWQLPNVTMLNI